MPIHFNAAASKWTFAIDEQEVTANNFWAYQSKDRPPNGTVTYKPDREKNFKFYARQYETYWDPQNEHWCYQQPDSTGSIRRFTPDSLFEGEYRAGNPIQELPPGLVPQWELKQQRSKQPTPRILTPLQGVTLLQSVRTLSSEDKGKKKASPEQLPQQTQSTSPPKEQE